MTSEEYKVALAEALRKLAGVMPVGMEWCRAVGKGAPKGGLAYLGQSVTRAMYTDLWDYVQRELSDCVISEEDWQLMFTSQNGNVPYYSKGNGSTTFRMPRISGYIKGATTLAEVGQYTKEGLPNILGSIETGNTYGSDIFSSSSGAFFNNPNGQTGWRTNTLQNVLPGASSQVFFEASRFNPIYSASDHVTPETIGMLFGVYAIGTIASIGEATEEGILAELESSKTTITYWE